MTNMSPFSFIMPKKFSEEYVRSLIDSDEYSIIDCNYKNQKSKIGIRHNKCGNIFYMDISHWIRGQRCPYCNRYSQKLSDNDFREKLSKCQPGRYTVLSPYKNKRTKVRAKCNICNNIFEALPESLYRGQCRICAAAQRSKNYTKDISDIVLPAGYTIVGHYINNKIPVEIMHNCGHTFMATTTNMRGRIQVSILLLFSIITRKCPSRIYFDIGSMREGKILYRRKKA